MNREAKIVGIFKAGHQTSTRASHRFSSRDRKDGAHRGFLSNEVTSRTRQYVAGDELRKGTRGVSYLRSQQITGEKFGLLHREEPGGRQS